MRLFSALFPPQAALTELADLVRATGPDTPELDPVPVSDMYIPVTNFGNVTLADGRALQDELRREAATWAAPKLAFGGGTALEWRGDQSVWAKLEGDLDQLQQIGRNVPTVVQRLGFFVDRRQFRPWLAVGTITDHTTAPYLERLVGALEGFRGQTWQLEHVCVVRRLPAQEDGSDGGFEVLERLPLQNG
jgi:RNA 2',3'-cyclic 3'-phosphodiesterase